MKKDMFLTTYLSSLKSFFSIRDQQPHVLVSIVTILYASAVAVSGFLSMVVSVYLGDTIVRVLLLGIAFLFTVLCIFSFRIITYKKQLIGIVIFTILSYVFAALIPSLPPVVELRPYDIQASLLKFFISSFTLVFMGIIAGALAFRPMYRFTSRSSERSAYYILIVSILLVLYPLVVIMGNIIVYGVGTISLEFLTEDVRNLGSEGGIFPAIIGTLLLMIGTAIVALPLGIGSALYLQEYARKGILVRAISVCVDILQGTPSIVHGLFGFAVFVPIFGISILSGILTLGVLTLPIIIRASEEAFRSVPESIREGSYAVGATKWQTIRKVVLPPAMPSIITGSVLGLGRAAGETAPIIFTAVVFLGGGIPSNFFAPLQALPYHLYTLIQLIGYKPVEANAWGTAFILLAIVLGMNAVAIVMRERFRVEF